MGLTHSTFSEPDKWIYLRYEDDAYIEFRRTEEENLDIIFGGHTHVPIYWEYDIKNKEITNYNINEFSFLLKKGKRYFVNIGSIGQPRDKDPRLSFAIVDTEKKEVKIIREKYNFNIAAENILKAGLPEFLATRLKEGN